MPEAGATAAEGASSSCRCFAGAGAGSQMTAPRRGRRERTCSWSASAIPGRATPAPGTTSASRSRTSSPAAGSCPAPASAFGGLISEGRVRPGGPRVAVLFPQTFMNESGSAAGPARGALGVPLDHVIVVHDEIDLPFGEVRSKLGGGVAGHNGLKSLGGGLGGPDFWRVRAGVGRPDCTDPEIVSSYVLSRFREPNGRGRGADRAAADEAERLVERDRGAGRPRRRDVSEPDADQLLDRPVGRRAASVSSAPRPATRSTPRCSKSCSAV